ncbi:MAG: hypothetical protein ACFB10_25360 [Salibacteraceae bacterium]
MRSLFFLFCCWLLSVSVAHAQLLEPEVKEPAPEFDKKRLLRVIPKVVPTDWLLGDYTLALAYPFSERFQVEMKGGLLGNSEYIWEGNDVTPPFRFLSEEDFFEPNPITNEVQGGMMLGLQPRLIFPAHRYNKFFFAGARYRQFALQEGQSIRIIEPMLGGGYDFLIFSKARLEFSFGAATRLFKSRLDDPDLLQAAERDNELYGFIDLKIGWDFSTNSGKPRE